MTSTVVSAGIAVDAWVALLSSAGAADVELSSTVVSAGIVVQDTSNLSAAALARSHSGCLLSFVEYKSSKVLVVVLKLNCEVVVVGVVLVVVVVVVVVVVNHFGMSSLFTAPLKCVET